MADKVTKEQVYTMLGKRFAGELKEHTGAHRGAFLAFLGQRRTGMGGFTHRTP
jgi:hypothetical protein